MKTLEQGLESIRSWYRDECVGNLVIFRAPRSQNIDIVGEQTVKLREMDKETQAAVWKVFDLFDSERVELFRDKDGRPDRVKVIRRF